MRGFEEFRTRKQTVQNTDAIEYLALLSEPIDTGRKTLSLPRFSFSSRYTARRRLIRTIRRQIQQ